MAMRGGDRSGMIRICRANTSAGWTRSTRIRWNPNSVSTGSETWPGRMPKATRSNSFTMTPRRNQPSSPPEARDPESSENRRAEGIISELSVQENITLALQAERGVLRRIRPSRQRELALSWVDALDIRPPDVDRPAGTLSGGNQQKVLIGRWVGSGHVALILDEPTRGVDVGAKMEIYRIIRELAAEGVAILIVTSELPEIIGLCDRVVVMREGRRTGELMGDAITEAAILQLAVSAGRERTPEAGEAAA